MGGEIFFKILIFSGLSVLLQTCQIDYFLPDCYQNIRVAYITVVFHTHTARTDVVCCHRSHVFSHRGLNSFLCVKIYPDSDDFSSFSPLPLRFKLPLSVTSGRSRLTTRVSQASMFCSNKQSPHVVCLINTQLTLSVLHRLAGLLLITVPQAFWLMGASIWHVLLQLLQQRQRHVGNQALFLKLLSRNNTCHISALHWPKRVTWLYLMCVWQGSTILACIWKWKTRYIW